MKWFRKEKHPDLRPDPADTHDDGDADAAVKEAQQRLDEARAQWPEVHRVSSSLRQMRERNHFSSALEAIFRGGTG